jgi:hypothetical protein
MRVDEAQSWAKNRQQLRQLRADELESGSGRLSGLVSRFVVVLGARLGEQKEILSRAVATEPDTEAV